MSSRSIVQQSSAPKKITQIQFGTLGSHEIRRISEVQVTNSSLFDFPSRKAIAYGPMDTKLGISDKNSECLTCKKKLEHCAGHFGHIQLELPVFHAGFFKHTLTILQAICKRCSRILLPEQDRIKYLRKLQSSKVDSLAKSNIFKRIIESCKKDSHSICPYCSYANGKVKKIANGFLKIIHEKFRSRGTNSADKDMDYEREVREIVEFNPELQQYLIKSMELLTPMRTFHLLDKITTEDMTLLWMNTRYAHPRNLIIWTVPVPPVPIRPSVQGDNGSTEDDITAILRDIVSCNSAMKLQLDHGGNMKVVAEHWERLQVAVAKFIHGEIPGIPRELMDTKPIRGLCQRLKGKQGRLRGNLSGKRVDFSGRTVISPDPNLNIDQIGVPTLVAKIMTYPEKVSRYNIEKLRKCILNGPDVHPGANLIRSENGARTFALMYAQRDRCAAQLRIGDIVERHMEDGDIVLFNRQPSLHKMSLMAHQAKIMPWRTFRFNECCCAPYNADFDGDEMNLHLPQTEEARSEAAILMNITNNLITPRNGEPLVAATQDFLTSAYLITQKDVFLTKAEFCRYASFFSDALEHIQLPMPAILRPIPLWTGKQLMSLLICPNDETSLRVNVESKEKFYVEGRGHFCPQDGYVCFRHGEHLTGSLGKKTLGGDSKNGLFYVLIRDYGAKQATRCMCRLSKFSARYIGERGFSIGIEDVTPSDRMKQSKRNTLSKGYLDAHEQIDAYKAGKISLKPGCNALQSLESEVNGILGRVRDTCGSEAMKTLHHRNAPLTMAQCGSKGSPLNISQMISCLGQQNVGGARIQNGFVNRTLPHFPVGSLEPDAKGFVENSFYSGLTATEFFFHTMGGREGLVDTAVKTAETGYMARRLMKALEDLSMQYDSTVRNSEQLVVQFCYGDDGLDPQLMETGDRPVDYQRQKTNICAANRCEDEPPLSSKALLNLIEFHLQQDEFQKLLPEGTQFLRETEQFFHNHAMSVQTFESKQVAADAKRIQQLRALRVVSPVEHKKWVTKASKVGSKEFHELSTLLCDNTVRLTKTQVELILRKALDKYNLSMIQPGEAIGAVGSQSLSEPTTQMTLKTFHFAGVASMNVTLGVPRLKEIINASKAISTPIITAKLVEPHSLPGARIVKAQVETTTLGDIAKYIREVHRGDQSYVSIKLDTEAISRMHLNIDAESVRSAIVKGQGVKSAILKAVCYDNISILGTHSDRLRVYLPEIKESRKGIPSHRKIYFVILGLKTALPSVIVCGISSVSRAVVNEESSDDASTKASSEPGTKSYHLLVEGAGLQDVMGIPGIDGTKTKSNHIMEMQTVLGIEAARLMISEEIKYVMKMYGITVDRRHLMLLSDVMTFKGEILGITRFGIAKMRESVLALASFEKTTDHLFDGAVHSRQENIVGVSECIIMGVPIPIGTGIFKLLLKTMHDKKVKCSTTPLLLDASETIA